MSRFSMLTAPWRAILGVVLAAGVIGLTATPLILPPSRPLAGPSTQAITARISERMAEQSTFEIFDQSPVDGAVLADWDVDGYDELVDDGHISWWDTSDGFEITLLIFRTGTENTASKGTYFLLGDLAGTTSEQIDDPVDARRVEFTDEFGDGLAWGWDVSDAGVIVWTVREAEDRAMEFMELVDREIRASGMTAPWLGNPGAVVFGVVGQASLIVGMLWGGRALARIFRRGLRCDTTGSNVDVTADAKRLRWMGRAITTIQAAALIVASIAFAVALMWFNYFDVGFFGSPLIAPVIVTALAIAASGLFRFIEGRSHRRVLRSRSGRIWAALPVVGGVAAIGIATLFIGMITSSAASDVELYNRLDAERFRAAQGVASMYFLLLSSLCLLLFTVGAALLRLATRLMVAKPSAGEWGSPAESTTLLLRSFGDDKLRINTLPSGRRGLISAWSFRASDRFEEVVAWELSDIGPLEAVGEPGARSRSLGAARTLLDPHDWTTAVWRRMQEVANVVAVVGDTPGFSWEVQALVGAGALDKTIFVMPPVARKTAALRWQRLRTVLEAARPDAASSLPTTIGDAIVFRVQKAGLWTVAVNRRDEAGYRTAIRAAIESQALSGLPPPPPDAVPLPGPPVRSVPDL